MAKEIFSFYRSKSTIFFKKFVFKTCYNNFRANIKGVFRTKISGLYSKKAAWQTWKAWLLGLQEAAKAEKGGRNNWYGQRVGSGRVVQVGNMNLHETFTRTGECTRIWRVPIHDRKLSPIEKRHFTPCGHSLHSRCYREYDFNTTSCPKANLI